MIWSKEEFTYKMFGDKFSSVTEEEKASFKQNHGLEYDDEVNRIIDRAYQEYLKDMEEKEINSELGYSRIGADNWNR